MTTIALRGAIRQVAPAVALLAPAAAFLYLLHLGEAHFSEAHQMAAGWGALVALVALQRRRLFRRMPWRALFVLLAAYVALRYLWWRTSETLVYTGPLDFVGMSALYLAEVYAISIYFLGMFVNLWPIDRVPAPLPEERAAWPTVDVFIPTYNEPEDLVRVTALAATQIMYPHEKLNVFVLDDGGTLAKRADPQNGAAAWQRRYRLMRMARELGVHYLTRETNRDAKAGNLNHALRHSCAELILFLDCDHVPTRDILVNTVGHFLSDARLFLVQTPHFFINQTPVEQALAGVAEVPDEEDMFYRVIHRGLDSWNSSYFCGSAALLRRRCLEEVGGISGLSVTEDAETALLLHCRGYNSAYIARPMVCGLSPESYDAYITQHTRWAQGMVQILLLNNPLTAPGLTLAQRLCYFNACFFWFFGLARLVYYIAPALFLMLGLKIYHASSEQVLAFAIPYVLSTYCVMQFFYGAARRPFFSEIYESVQSLFLIPAVISTLLHPHRPSFKVTSKEHGSSRDSLNPRSFAFYFVIGVNVVAFALGALRLWEYPAYRDVIAVTMAWCAYNIYLGLTTLGAFWERRQIRRHHRIATRGEVEVRILRLNERVPAKLKDISLTGIGVEIESARPVYNMDRVEIEAHDSYGERFRFEGNVQRAARSGQRYSCGVEFIVTAANFPDVVRYVFGDSARWTDIWSTKGSSRGTTRLLFRLLRMGILAWLESSVVLVRMIARSVRRGERG